MKEVEEGKWIIIFFILMNVKKFVESKSVLGVIEVVWVFKIVMVLLEVKNGEVGLVLIIFVEVGYGVIE